MPHFKADPESLSDLEYTPRFHCQLCGSGAAVLALSERKTTGGVLRELECTDCGALERVGICLDEGCSGWVLFGTEE